MTQQEKQQEFENDEIKLLLTRKPGCQVQFDIFVNPKTVLEYYQDAIKVVNKEVTIPGFRKGRAPVETLVKKFGKSIDREWRDLVLNGSFALAIHLSKIAPYTRESVANANIKSLDREQGAECVISFEAFPQIPEVNAESLTIEKPESPNITEEEIEQAIQNVRHHHTQWEEIQDRPIEKGDFVELDIFNLDENEEAICESTRFEVVEGKMGTWLLELLLGKQVGEIVEGTSRQEEESSAETSDKAKETEKPGFIPTRCKVAIKSIKKGVLPEVDDELAQKVGAASKEDMMEKIEASLKVQADEQVQNKIRQSVEKQLIDLYDFDIPLSIMESEKKQKLKRWIANEEAKKERRLTPEEIQQVDQELTKELSSIYKLLFLVQKISEKNQIDVTEQEILQETFKTMMSNPNLVQEEFDSKELRSRVCLNILTRKVLDFLSKQTKK